MSTFSKISNILLLAALFCLAGCASAPSRQHMADDIVNFTLPKLPEDGKAIVYVVRPTPMLGVAVRFNVFLDDKKPASEMGYNRSAEYIYFDVTPGVHTILSKAENWAEVQIDAKPNDIFFIQQDVQMGIVMARNTICIVDDVVGKYNVKHTTLGTIKTLNK